MIWVLNTYNVELASKCIILSHQTKLKGAPRWDLPLYNNISSTNIHTCINILSKNTLQGTSLLHLARLS